jgi:uncharacterized protein
MTSRAKENQTLNLLGQMLVLDSSGAVYWQNRRALIVADLHLGREAVLQKVGIAFPSGHSAQTLAHLAQALRVFNPQKLYILGDMVHARSGMTEELISLIQTAIQQNRAVNWILVEGNHDRGSRSTINRLGIEVFEPPLFVQPFGFTHDLIGRAFSHQQDSPFPNPDALPERQKSASQSAVELAEQALLEPPFFFCGHVHPGFRLFRSRDIVRCFLLNSKQMTLPAFGDIAGCTCVLPQPNESIFLLAEDSVIPWRRLVK